MLSRIRTWLSGCSVESDLGIRMLTRIRAWVSGCSAESVSRWHQSQNQGIGVGSRVRTWVSEPEHGYQVDQQSQKNMENRWSAVSPNRRNNCTAQQKANTLFLSLTKKLPPQLFCAANWFFSPGMEPAAGRSGGEHCAWAEHAANFQSPARKSFSHQLTLFQESHYFILS